MTIHDKAIRHWRIAFLVWFVVLTVATHWPTAEVTEEPTVVSPDKMMHMIGFGMLAFMFMCSGWLRSRWMTWCILMMWVAIEEVTQNALTLHREASLEDVAAGELGVACALMWMGALQGDQVATIRSAFEQALSKTKDWFLLAFVAVMSMMVTCTGVLIVLRWTSGAFYTNLSLFIGIIVTTVLLLCCTMKIGNMQFNALFPKKYMVSSMLGTIGLAGMVGYVVSLTSFDPWVATMVVLAVGSRVAWNRQP